MDSVREPSGHDVLRAATYRRWPTLRALLLVVVCVVSWRHWVAPTLRSGPPAPVAPEKPQSLADLHVSGALTAHVGLIVFGDFECPVCGRFAREVLPEIVRTFVHTGKVALAFCDLPLESIHKDALQRSVFAECAGRQGRFWEVHDRLFASPSVSAVAPHIVAGLDQNALEICLAADSVDVVRSRQARAAALGVTGTPTIYVGSIENEFLKVTDVLVGLPSQSELSRLLERRLRR